MKSLIRNFFVPMITVAIAGLAIAQNGNDTSVLNRISNYRQWTKVNADPVKVDIPAKIEPALVVS